MEKVNKSFQSFEESIAFLLEKSKTESLSLETILRFTSGKGKILLLILLSLVFGQIPILSFFFGLLIIYFGLRILFSNSKIWLPSFLLKKKFPPLVVQTGMKQILGFLKVCKCVTRPRYRWVLYSTLTKRFNGLMIALIGLAICVAPPVPLVGYVAIVALSCIGIGLLNEDGLYLFGGYLLSLIYILIILNLVRFFSFTQTYEYIRKICVSLY